MADLASWRKPDGGFFVGVTLNSAPDTDALLNGARRVNLALTDGRGFFADSTNGTSFVRLPFCALTPIEIEAGVARLAGVVRALDN